MSFFSKFTQFLKKEIPQIQAAISSESSTEEKLRLGQIHNNMTHFQNLLTKKRETKITPGEIFLCKEGFDMTQCPLETGSRHGICKHANLCDSVQKMKEQEAIP